jgi:peptide/nickel transport system substrate-binding protein
MSRTKNHAMFGLALASALALTACAGGGTGTGGTSDAELGPDGFAINTGVANAGGTIEVLSAVELSHLDPSMGNDGNITNFYRLMYRTLTTYANAPGAGGTEIVPDLATDTGTSNADATEWTYTLKDDIFYEDGTPIVAADVKYALERSLDPAIAIGPDFHQTYLAGASDYAGIYQDPAGLDSIVVTGDKMITFVLNQPLAGFPAVAATGPFTPFPAGTIESVTTLDEEPIASGPYKLESYQRGSSLTLIRNEFWDAASDPVRAAYPDSFIFTFGLDPNTIDQRMISGQGSDINAVASSTNTLLAANLSRVQTPQFMQRTVRDIPACTMYVAMNNTKEPFGDVRVRQAISYGINKNSVMNATGGPSMAEITHDMLTPQVPGREAFNLYPSDNNEGDVEAAQALLAEAGYPDGFSATIDVRAIPKWQAQAEAVQQSLARVGIDLTLNVIDASTYYEVIQTPSQQNDMAITGWCSGWLSGTPLLTPLFDGDRITEQGNPNLSQFNDPEINAAFDVVAQISDLDEQDAAYSDLNRAIMEKAAVVPLLWETPLQMVGSNVGNAFAHAGRTGYIDYTSVGLKNPEQ